MDRPTITQLREQFLNQTLTPSAHVLSEWKRLQNIDPKVNPIVRTPSLDTILSQARESTKRYANGTSLGPFDGIPITVKDTLSSATKGWVTNKGSKIHSLEPAKDHTPDESVEAVETLVKQGAIILCQTTVPELCWKGTTSSLLYGTTRYPGNLLTTSGGSSGGAAALAYLDIGSVHFGSDGAGSVRIPASCNGVIGLKPTLGLSKKPEYPYLSHVGPLSRYLDNIRVFMQEMLTCDDLVKKNPSVVNGIKNTKLDFSAKNIYQTLDKKLSNLKYAISFNLNNNVDYINPIIVSNVNKAMENFTSKYNICKDNVIRNVQPLLNSNGINNGKQLEKENCNFMLLVKKIWGVVMLDIYGKYLNNGKYIEMMDPALFEFCMNAKKNNYNLNNKVLLQEIEKMRNEFTKMMDQFFNEYDVLICPTLTILPRLAQDYTKDGFIVDKISGKMVNVWDCCHSELAFTCLFNITQQPAISLNCGFANVLVEKEKINAINGIYDSFDEKELSKTSKFETVQVPIGLQIIAPRYRDDLVLSVANAIINCNKSCGNNLAKL